MLSWCSSMFYRSVLCRAHLTLHTLGQIWLSHFLSYLFPELQHCLERWLYGVGHRERSPRMQLNHSVERTGASRLAHSQLLRYWRLAPAAHAGRSPPERKRRTVRMSLALLRTGAAIRRSNTRPGRPATVPLTD